MKENLPSFQEKIKNRLPTDLFQDSVTIIVYNLDAT